jgi:hypothetical protein
MRRVLVLVGLLLAGPVAGQAPPGRAYKIQTRYQVIDGVRSASIRFPMGLAVGVGRASTRVTDIVGFSLVCAQQGSKTGWIGFLRIDKDHPALKAREAMIIVDQGRNAATARRISLSIVNQTLNTTIEGGTVLVEAISATRKNMQSMIIQMGETSALLDAGTMIHAYNVARSYCHTGKIIDQSNPY